MTAPFVLPALVAALAVTGFDPPERERDPIAFEPVLDAPIEDGTSLAREAERDALTALLDHAEEKPQDSVRDDCRKWIARRRRDLRRASDDDRPFVLMDDLRDDPSAYRGQPLIVWGRTTSDETVDLGGLVVRRVDLAGHDDTDHPITVVLPADEAAATEAGQPVVLAGWFLKTIPGETEGSVVPVVVAGAITRLGDRLDGQLMATVENETISRPEERDAYLTAIAQARMIDGERLERVSRAYRDERIAATGFRHEPREFPTYVDLYRHVGPDFYHGRPVTLRGHTWAVSKVSVAKSSAEYGFETLYEVILNDEDGQTIPALIVCSEIPEGIPTSGSLEEAIEGITVTGFFFKLQAYATRERKEENGEETSVYRKMPVIVARTIRWSPVEAGVEAPGTAVYAAIGLFFVLTAGFVWWFARPDRRRVRLAADEAEPRFDEIDVDP